MANEPRQNIAIQAGGPAGSGIKSVGSILAKTLMRLGYHVFEYPEYPSLIRGGHNSDLVCADLGVQFAQESQSDILLAMNRQTVDLHLPKLRENGVVVYDPKVTQLPDALKKTDAETRTVIGIPMLQLARSLGADIVANNVGVGAVCKLAGIPLPDAKAVIAQEFHRKSADVIAINQRALEAGFHHDFPVPTGWRGGLRKANSLSPSYLLTGNDAVGLGAVAAGIGLYVAYPMTPSSSLLDFMASHQEEFGFIALQPEDEIAAANIVLGAMHAGVRAMCGTSGGGFALMNETLALSGMTEIPLVIFVAQRPGPATGLPTWTEQGELQYAIHAGHGEFLRFVLAPGDPQEAFQLTADAFNLSQRYQTPVIVLSDKYLAESAMSISGLDQSKILVDQGDILSSSDLLKRTNYQRYELTDTGISPRSLPGMDHGVFVANSDEHDYHGLVDESQQMRVRQNGKRLRKFETARRNLPGPELIGPPVADLTLITWGSTKCPALQSMKLMSNEQKTENNEQKTMNVNLLHFSYIWPMNREAVNSALSNIGSRTLIVENNATGQFESLLWDQVGFRPTGHLRKSDGRPFYPEEIMRKMTEIT